jgi:type IV secretory pathway VirB10-like protein
MKVTFLLLSVLAAAPSFILAQEDPAAKPNASVSSTASVAPAKELTVPAGTKVPLVLKHAISTKSAREGDSVYAETTFPVVENNRVLIPAGTYVQGKISRVQRAGRVKGRAEVLMHFTTLIYPSGYTVLLPGAVENVPGADKTSMKGEEGTIRQDRQTGQKVGTVASTAGTGAVVGGLSHGGKGAAVGAGIGGAVGTAIALLTRGNDVKLDAGTTVEMVIQRAIPLDASRIPAAGK